MGKEILLPEEELQSLEEGTYYSFQIKGCAVYTKDGGHIGTVEDVLFISGNDLLIVEKEDQEFLIPFAQSVCLEVDLEQKRIVIDPPEGLLDLNEI